MKEERTISLSEKNLKEAIKSFEDYELPKDLKAQKMTNKQFLTKLIQKAVDNGYSSQEEWDLFQKVFGIDYLFRIELSQRLYNTIIFDHSFCKAIWNEDKINYKLVCLKCGATYNWFGGGWDNNKYCSDCGTKLKKEEDGKETIWHHHIQCLALSEDRIKYLKDNVKL
jgi:hypothetical protein